MDIENRPDIELHRQTGGQSGAGVFTCCGCGDAITDQYVLRVAPDMEWHAACLRCVDCRQLLDENCTCFVRDGKVYCKPDYIRLFGTRCAKCHERFAKNDLVMKAKSNIYHVDCFCCTSCGRQLVSGDEFSIRDDAHLLCKADHEAAYVNNNNNGSQSQIADDAVIDDVIVSCANNNNDVDAKTGSDSSSSSRSDTGSPSLLHASFNPTGRPDQAQHVHSRTASSGLGYRRSCGRLGAHGGGGHRSGETKTTRIRTVLNEKQLHTLRTCYSANSRPDALMKEQLVEMTGLSPRVIRVWFQNKRCKDKKRSLALKQLHQQQQNKGVPLIATSPVRHELPLSMQPTPVEVHKYSAPWNDFHGSPDPDDIPSPPAIGPIHCAGLPLGLFTSADGSIPVHLAATLGGENGLGPGSFADSFDDDTVVSLDDLSDVVSSTSGGRYVASAPPTDGAVLDHAHSDNGFAAAEGRY